MELIKYVLRIGMIMIALGIIYNTYASDVKTEWNSLSTEERSVIMESYVIGNDYNLGLTLAAICWQESMGGRWQISTDGNDVGLYHINLHWYMKEFHIKDTIWNRSKYATLLITKPELSRVYVLAKLTNLARTNHNNWHKVWWRYNGSEEYALNIKDKVMYLKTIMIK